MLEFLIVIIIHAELKEFLILNILKKYIKINFLWIWHNATKKVKFEGLWYKPAIAKVVNIISNLDNLVLSTELIM